MDILFEPRFTISQIASATDVPATSIRSWYQRGILTVGMGDRRAEVEGLAHHFSAATAICIAITGALARNVPVQRAAEAALKFTHAGNDYRQPCHLYESAEIVASVLVLTANPEHPKIQIRAIEPHARWDSVFNSTLYGPGIQRGAVILELDYLVDSVRTRLGLGRQGEGK